MKVSEAFLVRLKLNEQPAYRIAQKAGVHPTTLSKLIRGAMPVRPNDDRIVRVGRVLGLDPSEVFELNEIVAHG